MKIRKITSALLGALALFSLAGCSDEKFGTDDPNLPEGDGEGYYMSLDILMPDGRTSSRSTTDSNGNSSDGVEVGADIENNVTSAIIVLANTDDYGFIAAGEVLGNRITAQTLNNTPGYKALARLQKTNLNEFYQNLQPNTQPHVYVFVFCNPTNELREMFRGANTKFGSTEWVDATCTVLQGKTGVADKNTGIWNPNSFLMNNADFAIRILPGSILAWEQFDRAENPFHLSEANTGTDMPDNSAGAGRGAVKVERSVARFDFKDGSPSGDQTYNVLYHVHNGVVHDGTNGTSAEPLVAVQLQRMALVNMGNQFYYLPRVSDEGQLAGDNYKLLGAERGWIRDAQTGEYNSGNYVVGPYASVFGGNALTSGFSNYFNYPFFNDEGNFLNATMTSSNQWDVYKISDVINPENRKDNYNNKSDYYVWRYVTENVIPAGPAKQVNGISTGVLFKGRMLGTQFAINMANSDQEEAWEQGIHKEIAQCLNGEAFSITSINANGVVEKVQHAPIKGNSTDDPVLYYLDGGLYLTWSHIRQAAIEASISRAVDGKLEINRSNSLYRSVFGDGPIPDGNYVIWSDGSTTKIVDPRFATAEGKAEYAQSADAAWNAWNAAGKPVPEVLGDEVNAPETLKALREKVTASGITMFQSSPDTDFGVGYYCYYYYWNRHNDNNIAGVMGPMEFDVVRNNVYKLSVDKISRIGHPRIPGNDPNPPTPYTPDESDEIYLDVTVEVSPWAVRLNSIKF